MTDAQLAVRRAGSALSTGPKTAAGKARVARNGVRHGLTAANFIILDDEDEEAYESLRTGLLNELQPVGVVEHLLVDRIASCAWRQRRAARIERDLMVDLSLAEQKCRLEQGAFAIQAKVAIAGLDPAPVPKDAEAAQLLLGTLRQAEILGHRRREAKTVLGAAFLRACSDSAFEKLGRYERAIDSGLHRALHELERIQRARAGETVPPPAVVDLNVTLEGSAGDPDLDQDGYRKDDEA